MLHVVIGPPCGGKSTYCQENAQDGDVVVDFDKMAQALGSTTAHASTGAIRDTTFEARQAVIDHLLKAGDIEAWIIHTSPAEHQLRRYREVGARFEVVDPGIEVCLVRALGRPNGTEDAIRKWYASPSPLEPSEHSKGNIMRQTKSLPVSHMKAGPADGLKEGEFLVYPSTFTREPDSYGDIVAKGAFARGIAARKEQGISLPGLFGHRMDDPDFYVAKAIEEGEDDHGWWVKGVFDLTSPKGPQVYELVKSGLLRELSFAYETRNEAKIDLGDGRKANELRDVDVFEFSFVPVGANRDTSVVAVKDGTRLVPGSRARALNYLAQLRL